LNVPEEEGLDWNNAKLLAMTLWGGKMFSSPHNGVAILWGPPNRSTAAPQH